LPLEQWLQVAVLTSAISAVLVALYSMMGTRKGRGKPPPPAHQSVKPQSGDAWPLLRAERTVTQDEVRRARDELRILDLEREILSFAIRRLYEAQAEGKITEEERNRLVQAYKSRMMEVKEAISRNESLVALHELESMREELIKLFSNRFEEINRKIEEIRSKIGVKAAEKAPPTPAKPSTPKGRSVKKRARRPKSTPPKKSEAEERIERIRAEVEKVLARLEQIEVEA